VFPLVRLLRIEAGFTGAARQMVGSMIAFPLVRLLRIEAGNNRHISE
jgi:hypothetical protein